MSKIKIWNGSQWIEFDAKNADEAAKLLNARSITLNGDVSGTVSFDGSSNVTMTTTVADDSHNHTSIKFQDTRSVDIVPFDYQGVSVHLKSNSVDGLSDGGTYHGILNLTQWSDKSGGKAHQLGLTDNNNIWHRTYDGTSFGSWNKIWDSGNFDPNTKLNTAGGSISGTLNMNTSASGRFILPVGTNKYA